MTTTRPEFRFGCPAQRLIVTFEGLDPVALGMLADGWIHRCVPRSFARCSPDELARRVFEIVRERVLELGFVDRDAE